MDLIWPNYEADIRRCDSLEKRIGPLDGPPWLKAYKDPNIPSDRRTSKAYAAVCNVGLCGLILTELRYDRRIKRETVLCILLGRPS